MEKVLNTYEKEIKDKLRELSRDYVDFIIERGCQSNITDDIQAVEVLRRVLTKDEALRVGNRKLKAFLWEISDEKILEEETMYLDPWTKTMVKPIPPEDRMINEDTFKIV